MLSKFHTYHYLSSVFDCLRRNVSRYRLQTFISSPKVSSSAAERWWNYDIQQFQFDIHNFAIIDKPEVSITIKPPSTKFLVMDQTYNVSCNPVSIPPIILLVWEWWVDAHDWQILAYHNDSNILRDRRSMSIQLVAKEAGTIRCQATNRLGSSEAERAFRISGTLLHIY